MQTVIPQTDRPESLLDALCAVHGVQGGTIHQYDLSKLKWACERRPSRKYNQEGSWLLEYNPDGRRFPITLGCRGAASRASLPKITPEVRVLWTRDRADLRRLFLEGD